MNKLIIIFSHCAHLLANFIQLILQPTATEVVEWMMLWARAQHHEQITIR